MTVTVGTQMIGHSWRCFYLDLAAFLFAVKNTHRVMLIAFDTVGTKTLFNVFKVRYQNISKLGAAGRTADTVQFD